MKKSDDNKYIPFDEFVVRTPLFSLDHISEYKDVISSDVFREAIYLASPSLYEFSKKSSNHSTDIDEKIDRSIFKYFLRASTRCTPFGLFAGCSSGTIAEESKIEFENIEHYKRATRLDMQYLCALIRSIENKPEVRSQLKFFPNDSLYIMGGKLRYIEYNYNNRAKRKYTISSVEVNDYIINVLEKSNKGATIDEMAETIISDQVNKEEAVEFINEIIDAQLVKSELDPSVVGGDVLCTLIDKLSRLKNVNILESLVALNSLLNKIDLLPLGKTINYYDRILSLIKGLGVGFDHQYLFQSDLFKPVKEAHVSRHITDQISEAITHLMKFSIPFENNNLRLFREAFYKRYEEAEVPLINVLDNELGLGYPPSQAGLLDVSILTDDLIFPSPMSKQYIRSVMFKPSDIMLFEKFCECLANGSSKVILTDEDFASLDVEQKFPDTITTMCSLIKNSGEYKIYLKSLGGTWGASLISRFCHVDDSIESLSRKICDKEQEYNPHVIYAEISHLPDSRVGNIVCRPALRDYTIHYLSNISKRGENISVSDIMISIKQGRIFLRSKSRDKEIVPRLTCAHNYVMSSIPVYRFLTDIQMQGTTQIFNFSWNELYNSLDYLPRIEYKNIIFSRQKWILKEIDFKILYTLSDDDIKMGMKERLKTKNMPMTFTVSEGDNEMYFDMDNLSCIKILFELLKKRKHIIAEEFLFDSQETTVTKSNNKSYTNEFIFTFHKKTHNA